MAVILGNKYQSKNRDNFRKITGLSEANEKIKPENMPRILGGIGEVWFNGQSAAGSSTGSGGGDTGKEDPNEQGEENGGGSGGGGSGGESGGGGGDNPMICEAVSVSDDHADKACAVKGRDCETGQEIVIQKDGNNTMPCDTPPNPQTDPNGYVVIAYPYPYGDGCQNIMLFPSGDIQGAYDAAATAGGDCLVKHVNENKDGCSYIKWLQTGDQIDGTERWIWTPQGNVSYVDNVKFYRWECGWATRSGGAQADLSVNTDPNSQAYINAVNAYNQRKRKNYFIKDGKIYDACDPYGTPPSSEPITMCDDDGNQYEVGADGKIKAL